MQASDRQQLFRRFRAQPVPASVFMLPAWSLSNVIVDGGDNSSWVARARCLLAGENESRRTISAYLGQEDRLFFGRAVVHLCVFRHNAEKCFDWGCLVWNVWIAKTPCGGHAPTRCKPCARPQSQTTAASVKAQTKPLRQRGSLLFVKSSNCTYFSLRACSLQQTISHPPYQPH